MDNTMNGIRFKDTVFNLRPGSKLFFYLVSLSMLFLFVSSAPAADLDQAIVHYNQGYDYYKKGEYDKAIEELESSLKFDKDNENAHYGLGNCYYRKQMYEKAVDGYKNAIKINPAFANAHYGLGTTYSALKKTDKADKEFAAYRELKSGQGNVTGAVASKDNSEKKSSRRKEKRQKKSSESMKRGASIKSLSGEKRSSLKNFSPTKFKNILTMPKLKEPKEYLNSLQETWNNSYLGKLLIGIIGFVCLTQAWLFFITIQCLLIWRIKKKQELCVDN